MIAVLLAGCSGSSSKPAGPAKATGRRVLLDSVVTTAAAKTARTSFSISMSGLGSASGFAVTADGAVDFASGDSQLTMQFGGPMASLVSGGLEVRQVNRVVYMKLPDSLLGPAGTDAKPWFKIDISKFAGGSASPLGIGGESDPTKFLAYLETVSNGVHDVGSDVVRGVDTKHYAASLDLGKAVDQADVPPALRQSLEQLLKAQGGAAPEIPADVWVDADGHVRRIQLQLDLSSFAGGADLGGTSAAPTMSMSMDLFDFGAPVDVVAPSADQVSDLEDFGMPGSGAIEPPSSS